MGSFGIESRTRDVSSATASLVLLAIPSPVVYPFAKTLQFLKVGCMRIYPVGLLTNYLASCDRTRDFTHPVITVLDNIISLIFSCLVNCFAVLII